MARSDFNSNGSPLRKFSLEAVNQGGKRAVRRVVTFESSSLCDLRRKVKTRGKAPPPFLENAATIPRSVRKPERGPSQFVFVSIRRTQAKAGSECGGS